MSNKKLLQETGILTDLRIMEMIIARIQAPDIKDFSEFYTKMQDEKADIYKNGIIFWRDYFLLQKYMHFSYDKFIHNKKKYSCLEFLIPYRNRIESVFNWVVKLRAPSFQYSQQSLIGSKRYCDSLCYILRVFLLPKLNAFIDETILLQPEAEIPLKMPDLLLTDTESFILETLGNNILKGEELLSKAGYDYSSHYRTILSNLVKRDILKNIPRKGYKRN